MIGKITFEGSKVALLGDDGVWTSADAPLAQYLNIRFCPKEYLSPASVPFGVLAVAAAGFEFDADVEALKLPDYAVTVNSRRRMPRRSIAARKIILPSAKLGR